MLVFDQLKKNDPELRLLALMVLGGLLLLLAGLWWTQIVSTREYQASLEFQTFRTVRTPALRGQILDGSGTNVLAGNRPRYDLNLYLEDLRGEFQAQYTRMRPVQLVTNRSLFSRLLFQPATVRTQFVRLKSDQLEALKTAARYCAASNIVAQISNCLSQPITLDAAAFTSHYKRQLALPFPLLIDLTPAQVARFEENSAHIKGAELDVQAIRQYPNGSVAAHVLGRLQKDNDSVEGEEAFFSYRMDDYKGLVGIEAGLDRELRGVAGVKNVQVNNVGYRQTETLVPAVPGANVVLTIDLAIQRVVETQLQKLKLHGAVVVMDARNGDILAMASNPTFDPNLFVPVIPPAEWKRINDVGAEKNRATQENYHAGSIFKPVVGLACLEAGLDPLATIYNPGYIVVGNRATHDLAAPGLYNFRNAVKHSSNTYFITNGIHVAGIANIVKLGERFHFGERIGLPTRQETAGIFPSLSRVTSSRWRDGDTANLCIGQGEIDVTPLQMAVVTTAIANGGTVFWPRLIKRIEPADPSTANEPIAYPEGKVRSNLNVKARNLQILKEAMLADVEDSDGTGAKAAIPGFRICGKTGTAEVKNERNVMTGRTTWFISFAPYESPRYAMVVMVEEAAFGSTFCVPMTRDIYKGILEIESKATQRPPPLARAN